MMRLLLYLVPAALVMALAWWAYDENYRTKLALERVDELHAEIGAARETLSVLRAEWAYLNRPQRLADLAALNFERLQLLPLNPSQFGAVDQVPFPPALPEVEPALLQEAAR
jgi:hypothetical protein